MEQTCKFVPPNSDTSNSFRKQNEDNMLQKFIKKRKISNSNENDNSTLTIDNILLGANLDLIDNKYLGNTNGYLGLDFLLAFKVKTGSSKMRILLNLKEIMNIKTENEIENEIGKIVRPENGHSEIKIKENDTNIPNLEKQNFNKINVNIGEMQKSSKSRFNFPNEENVKSEKITKTNIIQCFNSFPNSNDEIELQYCFHNEQPLRNSSMALANKERIEAIFENNLSNHSQLFFFKDYG